MLKAELKYNVFVISIRLIDNVVPLLPTGLSAHALVFSVLVCSSLDVSCSQKAVFQLTKF